jgi:mRNA interferase RelE/StbE
MKKQKESLAWQIEYLPKAIKQLNSLDAPIRKRIIRWLEERILSSSNPCLWGKKLVGDKLGDTWCYRVGDYRIACYIHNHIVTVTVVSVGHRRHIYEIESR